MFAIVNFVIFLFEFFNVWTRLCSMPLLINLTYICADVDVSSYGYWEKCERRLKCYLYFCMHWRPTRILRPYWSHFVEAYDKDVDVRVCWVLIKRPIAYTVAALRLQRSTGPLWSILGIGAISTTMQNNVLANVFISTVHSAFITTVFRINFHRFPQISSTSLLAPT